MSFKKPFRATPVILGRRYQRKQRDREIKATVKFLSVAAAAGIVMGVGSTVLSDSGRTKLMAVVKPVAVWSGMARAREPQSGDAWSGCNDARAAGTAPIHIGDPGYHEDMDGDGDGIACEPVR